ncbi:uncharacterized protein LOC136081522 [Hydra vulgaris]|uniref:Uncharacterized protein LOC136081522 n=1 Tax=Hydra vulgaris TaxID=6087 RepID=A0ABM4C070_HYDVU
MVYHPPMHKFINERQRDFWYERPLPSCIIINSNYELVDTNSPCTVIKDLKSYFVFNETFDNKQELIVDGSKYKIFAQEDIKLAFMSHKVISLQIGVKIDDPSFVLISLENSLKLKMLSLDNNIVSESVDDIVVIIKNNNSIEDITIKKVDVALIGSTMALGTVGIGFLATIVATPIAIACEGKRLDFLLRKGVYPYDWVDSVDKFNETQLPPKELFFSKLNDEDITDVFENFRDVCIKNYKLDPAWYYTSPGLAWDAALKLTKVKFELLSGCDMILMIKKVIRGRISMISNRLGASNNKYMDDAYDKSKESTFIQYLNANNLYGWAMSKPLSTHGFKWMDENEIENWKSVPCILEVDLDYPESLHDEHNDYPLAPERVKVNKVEKLFPNLNHKKNYVIYYKNLKLYERLGLKITKIHRGVMFEERAQLSQYIDLNTNLRTKATNDFEKDFFKLMNNSVFGKTMENIENRVDVRLITNRDEAVKLASRPNYESRTIFDENLIAIHMKRTKLMYNKPIYLGMCILELSKTLMYEFHYDYIKNKYADRAKLLFTDTDSLAYKIKTEDFYADIFEDIEIKFDTNEVGGALIEEFVGLRSKLYSYKVLGKENEKKCKGIKKNIVKKYIRHKDYKHCLLNKVDQVREMNVIRSHSHEVYTKEINKIALSADDDKKVILEDGIHTLAYGHYKLRQ